MHSDLSCIIRGAFCALSSNAAVLIYCLQVVNGWLPFCLCFGFFFVLNECEDRRIMDLCDVAYYTALRTGAKGCT